MTDFDSLAHDDQLPILLGESTCAAVQCVALQFVAQSPVQGRTETIGIWQPVPGPGRASDR